jgi:phage shock protein A
MDRKLEPRRTKSEADWGKRAEQALQPRRRHARPRRPAPRKARSPPRSRATEETLVQQRQLVEDMRLGIATAKSKLKTLNLRRGSLMAQARAHKKGLSAGGLSAGGRRR